MRDTVQEGNAFVIKENGSVIAEVTFQAAGDHTIVIDHTYVAEEMRGQKLAEDLIRRVVEYARESNQKIIPACSYADAQFRRHKEYQDVWQKT
ncbi:GNAT family N-acetyltransferase [Paenibacillus tuaregi]|uniref:GNAT family N-acetyltransferase n=1 Tax=Paenibacillus tuaregi TaxID=1816681 RepID=UPI000838844E|nr:GNAT family N-acetyltransferase [Paenibacillus tuaregi]